MQGAYVQLYVGLQYWISQSPNRGDAGDGDEEEIENDVLAVLSGVRLGR